MKRFTIPFLIIALMGAFCLPALAEDACADLVARFRAAQDAKDMEALRALVCWEGATEGGIEDMEWTLNRNFGLPIKEIDCRLFTEEEEQYIPSLGSNIEPVGLLSVFFETPPEDSRFFGAIYLVGVKDGAYVITAPKRRDEAEGVSADTAGE